ncbi:MAG: M28 family peptidase, partial [Deltaproteobacteria bacterium]|nr:M28 family peptidase [Deltaproteobacteria bacterium]
MKYVIDKGKYNMDYSSIPKLKIDVSSLAIPEGRMVGSKGHDRARNYLNKRMESLELHPYSGNTFILPYRSEGQNFFNIIGTVPGRDSSLKPLIIGAHYDSVIAAPCADDNAAAVAVALGCAETIRPYQLSRDIVIALFDAEEPPYFQTGGMGSIRFYEDQMDDRGVHSAIIMDLVGHDVTIPGELIELLSLFTEMIPVESSYENPDKQLVRILSGLLFITGAESHGKLVELLRHTEPPEGLQVLAALNSYVGDMSDQGIFRKNGIPYLFLSCGRWLHYHQPTDTVDRLNFNKIQSVMTHLINIVTKLSGQELKDLPIQPVDPV